MGHRRPHFLDVPAAIYVLAPPCVGARPQHTLRTLPGVAESHVSVAEFQAFIAKHPDRWEHRALRKDADFILGVFG